jgi:hypothetical protein
MFPRKNAIYGDYEPEDEHEDDDDYDLMEADLTVERLWEIAQLQ